MKVDETKHSCSVPDHLHLTCGQGWQSLKQERGSQGTSKQNWVHNILLRLCSIHT
jgi:hypothetical protein